MATANSNHRGPRFIDLTGQRFGKWTVIDEAPAVDQRTYWNCLCNCGIRQTVKASKLRTKKSKSCRHCCRSTHGKNSSHEYKIWKNMISRCRNQSDEYYGGRGITVCPQWNSFESFFADMGKRPSNKHTIDRVDNAKGYSPDNCRWATRSEQQHNTRQTRLITFQGETSSLTGWARKLGLNRTTLQSRLKRGWPAERALSTPVD